LLTLIVDEIALGVCYGQGKLVADHAAPSVFPSDSPYKRCDLAASCHDLTDRL
jgi:hypothetical protein